MFETLRIGKPRLQPAKDICLGAAVGCCRYSKVVIFWPWRL